MLKDLSQPFPPYGKHNRTLLVSLALTFRLWPQAPGIDLPRLQANTKSKAEVKNYKISHCPNKPEGFHHRSFPLHACRKEFQIKLLIQSNLLLAQPVMKQALSELLKSTELPFQCSSADSPLSLHFSCRTHSPAPMKNQVCPKFWDGLFSPRATDKSNLDSLRAALQTQALDSKRWLCSLRYEHEAAESAAFVNEMSGSKRSQALRRDEQDCLDRAVGIKI